MLKKCLIINKTPLGSCEVQHKIWALSAQLTDRKTSKYNSIPKRQTALFRTGLTKSNIFFVVLMIRLKKSLYTENIVLFF